MMDALLHSQALCRGALRAVTHEQQLRRNFLPYTVEDLNHISHTLHRPKIGDMHQYSLALRCIFRAMLCEIFLFLAAVQLAVYEVVDHLNVVGDSELATGS